MTTLRQWAENHLKEEFRPFSTVIDPDPRVSEEIIVEQVKEILCQYEQNHSGELQTSLEEVDENNLIVFRDRLYKVVLEWMMPSYKSGRRHPAFGYFILQAGGRVRYDRTQCR